MIQPIEIKVSKVVEPTAAKCYYKTLGTSIKTAQCPLPLWQLVTTQVYFLATYPLNSAL